MNVIVSNKGGRKLCNAGYMYKVKTTTTNSTRWECSTRKSTKCGGFLRTDINDINSILSAGLHNHPPNNVDVNVTAKMMEIKPDLKRAALVEIYIKHW